MSSDALQNDFLQIPRAALIASVVLHLLIPTGWLTVKALEALGIQIFPKTSIKDVYQEYVQVDLVGLPDISIRDLEKLDPSLPEVEAPAEAPKPVEVEDDLMAIEAQKKAIAEKEKSEADARAKKIAREEEEKKKALKQIEEEMKREQALKSLQSKERGRPKLKGNILSKGTSTVGGIGTPKDQYTAIIMAKIKERFFISPNQRDRGLNNAIHIELFPTGRVRSKRFVSPSQDSFFDSAVMQAIGDAEPFPIPEDLSLLEGGITVRFKAEE
jgi:TolA protein